MSRRLFAGLAACLALLLACPAARAADAPQVAVSMDRTRVAADLGAEIVLRSTIDNRGSSVARDLVAHLNVLSLRPGLYVDPEDWSEERTVYVPPIAPGTSHTVTWRVRAIQDGALGLYIAVLPDSGAPRPPVTGPVVQIAVAGRETLNTEGIVPLVLGIPAGLALLAVALRLRLRRGARAARATDLDAASAR